MNRIVRYDPFQELRRFMWSGFPVMDDDFSAPTTLLSVDAYEEGDEVIVKADLPGVRSEDIDVKVTADSVTIKAERKEESEVNNRDYIRKERHYGSVARTLGLPTAVLPDQAEAQFIDGSLTLKIKKQTVNQPKEVHVQINSRTNGHDRA